MASEEWPSSGTFEGVNGCCARLHGRCTNHSLWQVGSGCKLLQTSKAIGVTGTGLHSYFFACTLIEFSLCFLFEKYLFLLWTKKLQILAMSMLVAI